jgi:hypothetical protein
MLGDSVAFVLASPAGHLILELVLLASGGKGRIYGG